MSEVTEIPAATPSSSTPPSPTVSQQHYTPEQAQDVADHRVFAAVSYFYVLSFVVYLAKKQSTFARFHAKQGMVLCILSALFAFTPAYVSIPVQLLLFAGMVIGSIQSFNGLYYRVPFIYNLTLGKLPETEFAFANTRFRDFVADVWKRMKQDSIKPVEPLTEARQKEMSVSDTSQQP